MHAYKSLSPKQTEAYRKTVGNRRDILEYGLATCQVEAEAVLNSGRPWVQLNFLYGTCGTISIAMWEQPAEERPHSSFLHSPHECDGPSAA